MCQSRLISINMKTNGWLEASVDPINGHPLMLVSQNIQGIENLSEGLIKVFINDNHVQILFVLSLKHCRLFDLRYQLVILKINLISGQYDVKNWFQLMKITQLNNNNIINNNKSTYLIKRCKRLKSSGTSRAVPDGTLTIELEGKISVTNNIKTSS